jgi:hypothetical protein
VFAVLIDTFGLLLDVTARETFDAKENLANTAHLDFLGALGDPVTTVVPRMSRPRSTTSFRKSRETKQKVYQPVDVLKRLVTRVSDTTVDLHCAISGIAAKPVSAVVAHGDLVGKVQRDIGLGHHVHLGSRLENETAEHGRLGVELDKGPLDGLVSSEGLSKGLALLGVLDRLRDAVLSSSARRRSLTDPVLVDKVRGDEQAVSGLPKDVFVPDANVLERDKCVIRGHIERPEEFLDFEAGRVAGDDEASDSLGGSVAAFGTGKDKVVRGVAEMTKHELNHVIG